MKDKCLICGFDKKVHLHHIIKRKFGGIDEEENMDVRHGGLEL